MKYINEPIKGTGYSERMFALTQSEAEIIARELRPVLKSLQKKYDRYEDIRQSGEATERQLDKLLSVEERLDVVAHFIHHTALP